MMSGKLPANSFICNIDTAQMSGFREIAAPGQPPSHAERPSRAFRGCRAGIPAKCLQEKRSWPAKVMVNGQALKACPSSPI
jgi:hypothetical protein